MSKDILLGVEFIYADTMSEDDFENDESEVTDEEVNAEVDSELLDDEYMGEEDSEDPVDLNKSNDVTDTSPEDESESDESESHNSGTSMRRFAFSSVFGGLLGFSSVGLFIFTDRRLLPIGLLVLSLVLFSLGLLDYVLRKMSESTGGMIEYDA